MADLTPETLRQSSIFLHLGKESTVKLIAYADAWAKDREKLARLRGWVDDLQSGMFINCVYCGHRYGPSDEVPASMADVLKTHVEQCSKHPMSALKAELERLRAEMKEFEDEGFIVRGNNDPR